MKKQKNNGKVFVWIACVLSFLASVINVVAIVVIAFDLGGLMGILQETLAQYEIALLSSDLTYMCFELAIIVLIDLFAGLRYLRIARNRINIHRAGNNLMLQSVFQILLASLLAGVFGIIGISMMSSSRRLSPATAEERTEFVNDYKKKAMGEAIARLKELKAQGAISEEEYYETLNKILEG